MTGEQGLYGCMEFGIRPANSTMACCRGVGKESACILRLCVHGIWLEVTPFCGAKPKKGFSCFSCHYSYWFLLYLPVTMLWLIPPVKVRANLIIYRCLPLTISTVYLFLHLILMMKLWR